MDRWASQVRMSSEEQRTIVAASKTTFSELSRADIATRISSATLLRESRKSDDLSYNRMTKRMIPFNQIERALLQRNCRRNEEELRKMGMPSKTNRHEALRHLLIFRHFPNLFPPQNWPLRDGIRKAKKVPKSQLLLQIHYPHIVRDKKKHLMING